MVCQRPADRVLDLIRNPDQEVPADLYPLPFVKDGVSVGVIPLSGGADSTATAIVMRRLFPDEQFWYSFWDTKAEPAETYESLDRVEAFLGVEITRFVPKEGLFELIQRWDYFPSSSARWCTSTLKVRPFEKWIKGLVKDGGVAHTFVGLRADEDRVGLVSRDDAVVQHLPLKDLGITKRDVFAILEESGIGIPSIYRWGRTRSGCSACVFQRRSERVGLMQRSPDEFRRAEDLEQGKLCEEDKVRWHNHAVPFAEEAQVGPNHVTLPFPERVDARTRSRSLPARWAKSIRKRSVEDQVYDLFGPCDVVEVFALGEIFVHPGVGSHGVWWQGLVSWSTSLGGIKAQAERHWHHRFSTAEAFGLTPEGVREELNLVIYRLHLPKGEVDVDGPHEASFTWQSGSAYRQLRHVQGWIARTLHVAGERQARQDYVGASAGTWAHEQLEATDGKIASVRAPLGELMMMDRYDPKSDAPVEDEDERHVTCIACSV